jgi:hypothetical protein
MEKRDSKQKIEHPKRSAHDPVGYKSKNKQKKIHVFLHHPINGLIFPIITQE